MRKRFFNSKRILTLVLALSLVVGEAGVVVAAPAATGEQTEASVSANEVTESVDVQDSDVSAETAYDGTVSKVIGLEGNWSYDSSFTDVNGQSVKYVWVNPKPDNTDIYVPGKLETYKVAGTEDDLYLYEGQYYRSALYSEIDNQTNLWNPIIFLPAKGEKDPATGLYALADGYVNNINTMTINGQESYYVGTDRYDVVGTYANYEEKEAAVDAAAVKGENDYPVYYTINGKNYKNLYSWNCSVNAEGKYVLYANKFDEISLAGQKVELTWKNLSTDNIYIQDNKVIEIGYQVEENGELAKGDYKSADGQYVFQTAISYKGKTFVLPGQTATYRVRGLYYTYDKATDAYNVFKVGEWSDTYTYTAPTLTKLATVTGFQQVTKTDNDGNAYVKLSWADVLEANGYEMEYIRSDRALNGLTTANWDAIFDYGEEKVAFDAANPDAKYVCWDEIDEDDNEYEFHNYYSNSDYYFYVRVKASGSNINGYVDGDYSEIQTIVIAKKAVANVPQVQNFKVEYNNNSGDFRLYWTPVKANVVVYAVEKAKGFPEWYTYGSLNAYTEVPVLNADGTPETDWEGNPRTETKWLEDALDAAIIKKVGKEVKVDTFVGTEGAEGVSFGPSLKPGVEYSFVAYTYDSTFSDVAKAPLTYNGVNYEYYTDMSPVSATVTAKETLSKPTVYIASAADSLKLTMYGSGTGYEIYKKTGKKYKKLTVTTDNVYTDVDLKKNSKYNYKVRAYYYDKDSKVKCYSDWTFVTGETSDVVNMDLEVTKKNKTSVTLKWTKVKGATKYEIYRSNVSSSDPLVTSKKNSVDSKFKTPASAAKYELIKTVKGSKTKYVDKKLTTGDDYSYIVKAYYKNGKSTMYVSADDNVSLYLETPSLRGVLKGTSAKLSWDKDKFASKYQLQYKIYDADGNVVSSTASADEYTYVTTKKTSYTIKGIPEGGYATAWIRAYGNKKYTGWSSAYVSKSLDVAKNIKASNVVVKNADGVDVDAVKITWKAVKGAKYYEVYRSTKQGMYDADTKKYLVSGSLIAKESNDDEGISEVVYDEYLGVYGSIAGTTAYDYAQLDTGVTYYYYVVAYGEKNSGIYSEFYEDKDVYSRASSKPASVTYKATVSPELKSKKGKALITWDKVAGAKKYNVYRSTKKNTGYKLVGSTKKATYTDKKVSKGKTYYYKIEATGTNDLKANFTSMSSAKKIKVKK